ncbi:ribosomal large subunit pseudouridine synthase B [Desulfovibrionaceae bacterium]|nr:ribosomal large subunit pseudouridine synthase B [Desulfovibrionaceae bacterium]
MTNGVRLNKVIAAAGLCSRRKADELILAGQVRINGTLEENPARRVLPGDRIAVNDRELAAAQEYYYLLLHKPVQTVCTVNDPEGRPTVMAYLPPEVRHLRLYPVGRLDYFSEGLLLLTNDGELAQRLTHPRHHQPKTYEVLIRGSVPETALAVMRRGMRLDEGQALLPVDVEAKTAENGNTLLRMVLRQGVNRQIRRMCRDLGLTILRLRRVAQGPLALGNLKPGAARALTTGEVADLRQSVGLPSQV